MLETEIRCKQETERERGRYIYTYSVDTAALPAEFVRGALKAGTTANVTENSCVASGTVTATNTNMYLTTFLRLGNIVNNVESSKHFYQKC